jgi:Holliday junction resolvase RusA-like endonuclease
MWVDGKKRGQPFTPKSSREWRGMVETAARQEWKYKLPLEGPVFIDLVFLLPGGIEGDPCPEKAYRGDLEKAALDGLARAKVWKDSAQVCDGSTRKYWNGKKPGGVLIQIARWE